MAHAIKNRSYAPELPRPGIRRACASFVAKALDRAHRRITGAYLRSLSDRELRDIGIAKTDLDEIFKSH